MDLTRASSSPVLSSPDRTAAALLRKKNDSEMDGGSPAVPPSSPMAPRTPRAKDAPIRTQMVNSSTTKSATDILTSLAQYVLDVGGQDGLVDIDGEGAGLNDFETGVAKTFGKEDGLFFPTGVAANLAGISAVLAMRREGRACHSVDDVERLYLAHNSQIKEIHTATTVAVHYTSDMVHLGELADGEQQREDFALLAKLNCPSVNVVPYGRMEGAPNFSDIKRLLSDKGTGRAGIVVIELPQKMNGGATMSLADIRATRKLTKELGVHMHLDGSRLWEVQPYYAHTLVEICGLFDSVYIDFQKGLGAMGGAMLMGTADMIQESIFWRQRLGGLHKSFFPTWLDCKGKFDAIHAHNPYTARFDRLCELVHTLHQKVLTVDSPVRFWPRVPNACMIHVYIYGHPEDLMRVHKVAEQISGVALFDTFQGHGFGYRFNQGAFTQESWQYFEWRMGVGHEQVTEDDLVHAWAVFLEQLQIDVDRREEEERDGKAAKSQSVPDMANLGSLAGAPDWWRAPKDETPLYIKIEKEREVRRLKDMKPEAERFLMELSSPNTTPTKTDDPSMVPMVSPQSTSDVPSALSFSP